MSATLYLQPPKYNYSKKECFTTLLTDNITLQRANIRFTFTDGGPLDSEVLTLKFAGIELNLTFNSNTSVIATDLPIQSVGQLLSAYTQSIALALSQISILNDYFFISSTSTDVVLLGINYEVMNISVTGIATNVSYTVVNTIEPYIVPNLVAHIRIFDMYEKAFGATLIAPYDIKSRRCTFDIHDLFSVLKPLVPEDYSLDNNAYYDFEKAVNSIKPFKIRYADQYGIPPMPEKLQDSELLYMVYGDTNKEFGFTLEKTIIPLHNFPLRRKTLTYNQPEFCYILSNTAYASCYVRIQLNLSDDDIMLYYPPIDAFNIEANAIYCFRTGFKGLQLDKLNLSGAKILSYDFQIIHIESIPSLSVKFEYRYEVDSAYCEDDMYLLLDNQCGGMETLRLWGNIIEKNSVEQSQIDRVKWLGDTEREGTKQSVDAIETVNYDVTTGLLPTDVARYYKELLRGDIYFIDRVRNKFVKAYANSKDVSINPKSRFNQIKFSFSIEKL